MKDKVSTAVIQRLPRYYRYLSDLLEENVERISSSDLAARMHVTASQIRQDLNTFGGFGQQGYGYHVPHLHAEIGKLLGIDQQKYLIIIGAGNLGQALANYQNFTKRGFQVKALFDIDPEVIGRTIQGAQVFPLEYLEAYLEKNAIDIATLTLPSGCVAAGSRQSGILHTRISGWMRMYWSRMCTSRRVSCSSPTG